MIARKIDPSPLPLEKKWYLQHVLHDHLYGGFSNTGSPITARNGGKEEGIGYGVYGVGE